MNHGWQCTIPKSWEQSFFGAVFHFLYFNVFIDISSLLNSRPEQTHSDTDQQLNSAPLSNHISFTHIVFDGEFLLSPNAMILPAPKSPKINTYWRSRALWVDAQQTVFASPVLQLSRYPEADHVFYFFLCGTKRRPQEKDWEELRAWRLLRHIYKLRNTSTGKNL